MNKCLYLKVNQYINIKVNKTSVCKIGIKQTYKLIDKPKLDVCKPPLSVKQLLSLKGNVTQMNKYYVSNSIILLIRYSNTILSINIVPFLL